MVSPPQVAADPERYATLNDLKAGLLDGYPDTPAVDAILLRCLDTASGIIEDQTGRVFTATTEIRSLNADGAPVGMWDFTPGGLRLLVGDFAELIHVSGPDAVLDPLAYAPGPVVRGPWRPWRYLDIAAGSVHDAYAIEALWGFAVVPPAITGVTLSIAARSWKRIKAGYATSNVGLADLGEVAYADSITPADMLQLQSWKIPVIA